MFKSIKAMSKKLKNIFEGTVGNPLKIMEPEKKDFVMPVATEETRQASKDALLKKELPKEYSRKIRLRAELGLFPFPENKALTPERSYEIQFLLAEMD